MLKTLNVEVTTSGDSVERHPVILVGNHISYVDIPLLMKVAPVVFVAKRQLQRWPIFGAAATSVGTIYVDRDSKGSRNSAIASILPALKENGQSIAIFPSGTTTMDEAKPWRWGAFRLAKACRVPIQPFRIRYTPVRKAAYLLEDVFFPHLFNMLDGSVLKAHVEFHTPIEVSSPETDAAKWWEWSRESLDSRTGAS